MKRPVAAEPDANARAEEPPASSDARSFSRWERLGLSERVYSKPCMFFSLRATK